MTRLGKHQRHKLAALGSPFFFQISGCAVTRALAKRGLMKPFGFDGSSFYAITPAGLRTLADELEADRITQEIKAKP